MAPTSSALLFSSAIFLAFTLTNAVSDSNITQVCSTTNDPAFCQKTLKSDPTWTKTDIHGLGDIALKQATDRAKYVPQYLGSIIPRAEPALAAKYEACSKDYETVNDELAAAAIGFKEEDLLNEAFTHVKTAFDVIGKSLDRFREAPNDMSQFTSYSKDIQTLCQAFMTIVLEYLNDLV